MSHRRNGNGGNGSGGGVPDWFFWTLAFVGLVIVALLFMFGDRMWL